MGYTEEQLAALSQTEREALTAPDEEDDETLQGIVGDDDSDDDDEDESDEEEESGDDELGDEKAAGEDKGSDEKAVPAANTESSFADFDLDSVPAVTFVPKLTGEVLPTYEAEIEALDAKLDEGEISAADHRKEVRRLEAQSQNEIIAQQLWQAEQAAFAKSLGHKSIAAFQEKSPEEFAVLNKEVIKVANDPANKGLTGIQTLFLAKHNLSEAAEIAEARAYLKAKKAGTAPPEKKIPGKPAAARPNQQTLRDAPAADAAEVGADKYAYLDKLTGMALEKAVSKLSPAEYEAYTRGV